MLINSIKISEWNKTNVNWNISLIFPRNIKNVKIYSLASKGETTRLAVSQQKLFYGNAHNFY